LIWRMLRKHYTTNKISNRRVESALKIYKVKKAIDMITKLEKVEDPVSWLGC
jgi:hypothetical protein